MPSSAMRSHSAAHDESGATAGTTATGPHFLTPSPSTSTRSTSGNNPGPSSKRRRINFACDYCRSRKTRCDEGQPSCYACSAAGIQCVTRNRRQPWLDVRRHEAGKSQHRSEIEETARQDQIDSNSISRRAATLSTIPTHEDRRSAPASRRDRRQQDHENETITTEEDTALSSIQGPPQAENDDTIISNPACSYPARQTQGTSTHRSSTTQGEDDRPELRSRLPIIHADSGNTSLDFMTSWLDLARHRLQIPRSGPRQAEQSDSDPASDGGTTQKDSLLPIFLKIWGFPEQETLSALIDWFLEGPNIVFPVLQPDKIRHVAQRAYTDGPKSFTQQYGLAVLMQVYLVMILGHSSRPNHHLGFDAEGCLEYSQSLLGLVLQQVTIDALRAVTLLSMALRCHENLAAAGHTMSLAVSMAISLGLPKQSPHLLLREERRNVWISVFSFEKFLSFELGRASLIADDCPDLLPGSSGLGDREHGIENRDSTNRSQQQLQYPICEIALSLATVLSDVGRLCVQVSRKEDEKNHENVTELVREKVRTIGLSCVKLMSWASDVCPSGYSPIMDILFNSRTHPFASFIAMQYHIAVIIVTRNSLLISEKAIRLSVDVIAKDEPWEYAVRNGQSLAANSARKILRLFLESSENQTYPVLPSLAGPLHAMGALAVFVVTRQNSRMASMDRELLKAAALAVKDANTLERVKRELEFALNKLNAFVTAATGSHRHNRPRPSHRSETESSTLPPEPTTREQIPISAWNPLWQVPEQSASPAQGSGEIFSLIPSGQMSTLDGHNDLTCSDWWIEDNSPMIMDELGWNWANFSQLLDGRDIEHQIQL
ncbi:hypothetical protein COCMIDRAFT_91344 [Bipolaris oryzae ATCC 44560]|uniref:Zn(2)-C6 fungal-type domain-containing protein n=1 Tax=Bipolaris oryzae ATCC 44560 TaxID=930090 RepID=W6ZAH8_COCMI|nr:uncharacterized protein COCMIDRAFT_91344 [Bipolaris oryzae ATCC 44560]EUC46990.1 hypothetical protein COCMIDRAFT_91344 [Bipolaris oryzae ATCC 44560]